MYFTWSFIILLICYGGLLLFIPGAVRLTIPILLGLFGLWLIDLWLTRRQAPLAAERSFEQPAYQQQPHQVELSISNPLRRPVRLALKDEPPFEVKVEKAQNQGALSIPVGGTVRFSYLITAPHRGKFTFGGLNLKYSGPFGLYNHPVRLTPVKQTLEVYPNLSIVNAYRFPPLTASELAGVHRERIFKMTGDFAQIREYASGDDFRKINWKVTAHIGKPVVNQFEPEKDQQIYLFFDTGRLLFDQADGASRTRMDYILDSSLLLAYNIAAHGDLVGTLSFHSQVERYVPAGKGQHHLELLMRSLFDLQPVMVESDYREAFRFWQSKANKRCLLFIYTDISDAESSRELIANLQLVSRRHLVVCILMRQEYLNTVMEQPLLDETAAYLKATAWELHRERENLKRLLTLNGIKVLEVSASNIRRTVVEHYQYLKHSGQI